MFNKFLMLPLLFVFIAPPQLESEPDVNDFELGRLKRISIAETYAINPQKDAVKEKLIMLRLEYENCYISYLRTNHNTATPLTGLFVAFKNKFGKIKDFKGLPDSTTVLGVEFKIYELSTNSLSFIP